MQKNFNNMPQMIEHFAKNSPRHLSHIYKDHFGREVRVSYKNFHNSILKIASGLISLGMKAGSKAALISHTSYEWTLMDFSLLSIGAVSVPRGTDTPIQELSNIIDHSEPEFLIIETYNDLNRLVPKTKWNQFKKIIILQRGIPYPKQKLITLTDLYELGTAEYDANKTTYEELDSKLSHDTLATIIYTSGTTGQAKGVMLTHGNFLNNVKNMTPDLNTKQSDLWVSILPVWHAFERSGEYMSYNAGSTIVFSSIQSVSNDITEYKPTYMNAVPKFYITIKDKIQSEFNKKSPVLRSLLKGLLRARQGYILRKNAFMNRRFFRTPEDMNSSFRDRLPSLMSMLLYALPAGVGYLLFTPIRKKMGGRLRAFISGGGSLPVDVDLFFWALGLPVVNAYGATESSPGISGRRVDEFIPGTVGKPFPGTEITIRNEEGMVLPKGVQGEIWVKGKQIMQGYYKEPELT
ncbi:MAG: AMP-binding protein, partial [Calditrichia bacterium]|nr:AMP-binding protein [Calditrichia bacterium]